MGLNQFWLREQTKEEKAIALLEGKRIQTIEFGYYRKYCDLNEVIGPFLDKGTDCIVDDTVLHYVQEFAIRENDKELKKIVKEAKQFIDKGLKVTYYASW